MINYVKRHLFQNSVLICLVVICAFLQIMNSSMLSFATNAITDKEYKLFMMWMALDLSGWTALYVLSFISDVYQEKLIQDMNIDMRIDLINKGTKSVNAFHKNKKSYYESGMMNDINLINSKIFQNFYLMIQMLAILVFSTGMIIFFQWKLFILTFVLGIISIYFPRYLNKKAQKASKNMSAINEKSLTGYNETIDGVDTFSGLGLREKLVERIYNVSRELKVKSVEYARVNGEIESVAAFVSSASQVALLTYTGILIMQGATEIGTLLSIASLAGLFFTSTKGVSNGISKISGNKNLFDKFIVGSTEENDGHRSENGKNVDKDIAVIFDNVSYKYDDSDYLFKNISFNIEQKRKYFLVGPSGSGKSTIFSLITKSVYPDAGEITDSPTISSWLYVPQEPVIFSESILYNLTLGEEYPEEDIVKVLKETNLYEELLSLSNGLNTILVDNGSNISGGQRQRISLARVLLRKPTALLLDEATSAVDSINEYSILSKLYALPNTTIISIIHTANERTLALADSIIDMERLKKDKLN
ncbi:ABC transporter ATP-binding protein [Weissella minor]|nr:ABC transporter ATP-binding protein [Weissella minor]